MGEGGLGGWPFLIGLACLFAHELDAVRLKEWRMLPLLSRLDDARAERIFIVLHLPLFAAILLLLAGFAGIPAIAVTVRVLDAAMIAHALLHLRLRNHPENRFSTALSWSLILGAGAGGLIDLIRAG